MVVWAARAKGNHTHPHEPVFIKTPDNCSMLLSEGGPPPSQEPPNCCTTGLKYFWYRIVIPDIFELTDPSIKTRSSRWTAAKSRAAKLLHNRTEVCLTLNYNFEYFELNVLFNGKWSSRIHNSDKIDNCSMLLIESGPPSSQEPPNCCTTGLKYV